MYQKTDQRDRGLYSVSLLTGAVESEGKFPRSVQVSDLAYSHRFDKIEGEG